MRNWAGWLVRGRWLIVAGWALLAIAGGALGGSVYDHAQNVGQLSADAESLRAEARLQQLKPEGETVFAISRDVNPYDPALVATTTEVAQQLRGMAGVRDVGDLYTAPGGQIGQDERSTLVRVTFTPGTPDAEIDAAVTVLRRLPNVLVGGKPLAERAFTEQAVADAALGEGVALAALALLLVVVLRWGAVAPLAAAVAAITTTVLALSGLALVTAVSEYTVNVVTLLGLGLAVDYSILLLWRYREENDLAAALRTAGRAVLVSGGVVGVAMAGLAVFGEPLLAAMALGGLLVTVVATAASLTLTPALLAILGPRLVAREPRRGRWLILNGKRRHGNANDSRSILTRLAAVAQKGPESVAFASTALLIILTLPFVAADLWNTDARGLPSGVEARQAYEVYLRDFQRDQADAVTVVVDTGSGGAAMRDYLDRLNRLPGVGRLQLRLEMPPEATVVDLTPVSSGQGPAVVRAVREVPAPANSLVGGPAAELADYQDSVTGHFPVVLIVLLAATGALLFLLTRSIVIPVKAVLLNLLTLGASLGVLAVVFGGRLDATTPVLLFVFIFGLTTDYEVFLLARITEEHRSGYATDEAVRRGIARTGPVVTLAGLSLILVFLGFVLGGLSAVREIGVGMAVAIALDVTVVRGLLLPAVMTLLGRWNWWPGDPTAVEEGLAAQSPDGPVTGEESPEWAPSRAPEADQKITSR
ncbi:RND superfamily putative drug exporter [Hamadaea flava]|uniref:MMPL family transporter n=1 Tax=Hamadaea flava TaxID=1742688 RepID=A0ABV8LEN8_9ACTN|nr:MMPL family transporter [Hamadaea flava]MCP2326102.1 RND superfamily putative drug exporter [Hamadaea flava]